MAGSSEPVRPRNRDSNLKMLSFSNSSEFANINHLKGLILAQNERWRRGLGMQVEREPRVLALKGTAADGVVIHRLRTLGSGIATGNCD